MSFVCLLATSVVGAEKTKVDSLQTHSHDTRGDVYIKDQSTLEIQNFHYDGTYFHISTN